MDFDDLLRKRIIEVCELGAEEVAGLIRVAHRDITTASSLMQSDLDWAFAVAYNAILQSSVALMAAHGFRPNARNKHYNAFRFVTVALPNES